MDGWVQNQHPSLFLRRQPLPETLRSNGHAFIKVLLAPSGCHMLLAICVSAAASPPCSYAEEGILSSYDGLRRSWQSDLDQEVMCVIFKVLPRSQDHRQIYPLPWGAKKDIPELELNR